MLTILYFYNVYHGTIGEKKVKICCNPEWKNHSIRLYLIYIYIYYNNYTQKSEK